MSSYTQWLTECPGLYKIYKYFEPLMFCLNIIKSFHTLSYEKVGVSAATSDICCLHNLGQQRHLR